MLYENSLREGISVYVSMLIASAAFGVLCMSGKIYTVSVQTLSVVYPSQYIVVTV
jgi:hypothetical protein